MKKIVLVQNDDGTIELDGQPVESPEDAIEQVKMMVSQEAGQDMESEGEMPAEGESGEMESEMPSNEAAQENDMEDEPMESESIGKTLESKLPMVDKKKRGMMPSKKASFEDYGI